MAGQWACTQMQCVPPPPGISNRDPFDRLVYSIWYINLRIKQNNSSITEEFTGLTPCFIRATLYRTYKARPRRGIGRSILRLHLVSTSARQPRTCPSRKDANERLSYIARHSKRLNFAGFSYDGPSPLWRITGKIGRRLALFRSMQCNRTHWPMRDAGRRIRLTMESPGFAP